MPLVAAIGQILWPIEVFGHAYAGFFDVFYHQTCPKRALVDAKAPINNRGMTYQNDQKDLADVVEHSKRSDNLVEYC
jgi:hypothetical protein